MSALEYEEWRLAVQVISGRPDLDELVEETRSSGLPGVEVHRRRADQVLVYALDEQTLKDVEDLLGAALDRRGADAGFTTSRWNPGAERWQDPSLPVEARAKPLGREWVELGEMAWEVRVRTATVRDSSRLESALRTEGKPVFTDGWKRVLIGVKDDHAARELANSLRLRTRHADITVRPLSRFRRWLIRQAILGNYGG